MAFASDDARSWGQYWRRRVADWCVAILGLNRPSSLATEVVQAICPVSVINTPHGAFRCRAGHGRLVWRAETFLSEEPDTIAWLNALASEDVLWDVGANVGLYSIYAAKFRMCRVVAVEPEAQNYALLIDNIALNRCKNITPTNVAMCGKPGFGRMAVRAVTKGGAFNQFRASGCDMLPHVMRLLEPIEPVAEQFMYGISGDELISAGLPSPTHIKLDVDGLEPEILKGWLGLLRDGPLRSVLIELNMECDSDCAIPDLLRKFGFQQAIYGDQKASTKRASPMVNMIFER